MAADDGRHLAALLDAAPVVVAPRSVAARRVPLLPTQVGFLFDRALGVDSGGSYTMSWWVDGEIAEPALRAALRSTYLVDSEPVGLVQDEGRAELVRLSDADDEDQARPRLLHELARPFAVESGEVMRAVLVAVRARTLFACAVHHIAFDGYSESLFVRDLSAAYDVRSSGRPVAGIRW